MSEPGITVAEYLTDRYVPSRTFAWSGGTLRYRLWAINAALVPDLGNRPLADLTTEEIERWIAWRAVTPYRKSGRLPEHGSLRAMLDTLKAALGHAAERGVIPGNPARGVRLPRDTSEPSVVWTPEQVRTFLAGITDPQYAVLWRLMFATGLRRGEALGLRWQDIDLDAGRLTVNRALLAESRSNNVKHGPPKTRRSRRTLSLDAGTVAALADWREQRAAAYAAHLTGLLAPILTPVRLRDIPMELPAEAPVFGHPDNSPLVPSSVSATFTQHVRASGLPRILLHDVRHTHLTLLLRAGEPVHVVSARAGHATPFATLNTYAHAIAGDDERAARRIGDLLADPPQAS